MTVPSVEVTQAVSKTKQSTVPLGGLGGKPRFPPEPSKVLYL